MIISLCKHVWTGPITLSWTLRLLNPCFFVGSHLQTKSSKNKEAKQFFLSVPPQESKRSAEIVTSPSLDVFLPEDEDNPYESVTTAVTRKPCSLDINHRLNACSHNGRRNTCTLVVYISAHKLGENQKILKKILIIAVMLWQHPEVKKQSHWFMQL